MKPTPLLLALVFVSPGVLFTPCLAAQEPGVSAASAPDQFVLEKIFHIAGIPGVKRNARGDLILSDHELIFQQKKKPTIVVPYERIQLVQLLSGARYYGKSTTAAAVASPFGVGALLILKKRKVDALVVDFVNERGGRVGMVLQVPLGQGAPCQQWLERFGVVAKEPEPLPPKG